MKPVCSLFLLFCGIVLSGCISSTKMLQKRQYDLAIAKAVQKLDENPGNQKEQNVLAKAYKIANEQDNDRIRLLTQSNEPQIWEEVYSLYSRLQYRKDLVKPLGSVIQRVIGFDDIDYNQSLIDSKRKAAVYLFNQGKFLLAKNTRADAREAYGFFDQVKSYLPAWPGIDDSMNTAAAKGITYVYFKIQNTSDKVLPRVFEEDLTKISMAELQNKWITFDTRFDNSVKYNYGIVLNIRKIKISPELMARNEAVETRMAEDGFDLVLDPLGKPMKDSLGNDVKKTKLKSLSCAITRFSLGKTADVTGTLDFVDNSSGQIIKTGQIAAQSKWEFVYVVAKGDPEALSPETRKLTTLKITPFPSNEEMIQQTGDTLKVIAKNLIYASRGLLQ